MKPEREVEMRMAIEALSQNGRDEQAWRTVVTGTWPIAIATANRVLRGALDLAEDAASEAFVRIARYADFRFLKLVEPDDFVKYLTTVVRHCAYDLLREVSRRSRQVPLDLEILEQDLVESTTTPETIFAAHELREELSKSLDAEEQKLLDLVLEGRSAEEISRRLEISEGSARVRLHRMRTKIRNIMKTKGLF